jgi:PilZ domain-containing protein
VDTPRSQEIFGIPIILSVIIISAMMWLARQKFIPFFWHGLQLFMAFELLPHALMSVVKPFGKPLLKINPVTPKGEAAMGRRIDVHTLACLLVVILLIVTGLIRAGHDERIGGQPLEMATLLFWIIYSMIIVVIASLICFEPLYLRRGERFDLTDEPASLVICGQAIPVSIMNMSESGARLRLPHQRVGPMDQLMHLQKSHVGLIPCKCAYMSQTELAVEFLPIDNKDVRHALVRDVYTNPVVQRNRQAKFEIWPVVKRLCRLLVA